MYKYIEELLSRFGSNCIVAGGCFKDLDRGLPAKDFDLFVLAHSFYTGVYANEVNRGNIKIKYKNTFVIKAAVKMNDGKWISVDFVHLGGTLWGGRDQKIRNILNYFDFTVSKKAAYLEDGLVKYKESPDYRKDLEGMVLTLESDDELDDAYSTFNKRMTRYISYGFMPSKELKLLYIKYMRDPESFSHGIYSFYDDGVPGWDEQS